MKTAHIRDEVDAEFDRMKWLHQARKARAKGIADLAPPPGGWVGAASSTPKHETPPAIARAGAPPIRYADPVLPAALADPLMAPFRLPAARAAKPTSAKPAKARASASVDKDVAAQRGQRNAARKVAAALAGMK
jgi:hypothetical protein